MGETDELRKEVNYLRDELHKEKLARHEGAPTTEPDGPEGGPTPDQAAMTAYEEAKAQGTPNDEARAKFLKAKRERFAELRETRRREDYFADVRKTAEEGKRVPQGPEGSPEGVT